MADIAGGGRSRWWIPAAAVFFLVAAAVAVAVLLTLRHDEGHPDQVARQFLDADSCTALRGLADDKLRARLDARSCRTLTDAASGQRTYTDPVRNRRLTRDLHVTNVETDGNRAQVSFTVSYSGQAPVPPDERIDVVLVRRGDDWLVQNWGLPR